MWGSVGFFLVFGRAISCYNEPEVQDFTKTATVDRIWLNLNETFKGNKCETKPIGVKKCTG